MGREAGRPLGEGKGVVDDHLSRVPVETSWKPVEKEDSAREDESKELRNNSTKIVWWNSTMWALMNPRVDKFYKVSAESTNFLTQKSKQLDRALLNL